MELSVFLLQSAVTPGQHVDNSQIPLQDSEKKSLEKLKANKLIHVWSFFIHE